MRTLAPLLALLVVVGAWFAVFSRNEPVLATQVWTIDVDVRDTQGGHAPRPAAARPRLAERGERQTKPGPVDPAEIIGLIMMFGSQHGR